MSGIHRFVVELQAGDTAQLYAGLAGHRQRCADLGDALYHLHTHHNGVLLVEDTGGQDLQCSSNSAKQSMMHTWCEICIIQLSPCAGTLNPARRLQ